ncbi:MAG: hypothetical protein N4A63_00475 [Vallitalea sp.]|jgi:hypothetical protein|nr:hypothetical protein [Vallitalea sp.]
MHRKEVVKELDKEQRTIRHNNKIRGKTREIKEFTHKTKIKSKKKNKNDWFKIIDEDFYIN